MKRLLRRRPLLLGVVSIPLVLYGLTVWQPSFLQLTAVTPPPATASVQQEQPEVTPAGPPLSRYIEVVDGCGPHFEGTCVNLRTGPGLDYPVAVPMRTGMVLKVASTTEQGGRTWYEIGFDGVVRYPERVLGPWYVAAENVREFSDVGLETLPAGAHTASTKRIEIDRTKEMLYAYEGDTLFMQEPISTGLEYTPTPLGRFEVFMKMPDSYMQGPIPGISDQYYDLPGVPWDLYFTHEGGAIHGAYWHNNFGQPWSHGCVNLPPDKARMSSTSGPISVRPSSCGISRPSKSESLRGGGAARGAR